MKKKPKKTAKKSAKKSGKSAECLTMFRRLKSGKIKKGYVSLYSRCRSYANACGYIGREWSEITCYRPIRPFGKMPEGYAPGTAKPITGFEKHILKEG